MTQHSSATACNICGGLDREPFMTSGQFAIARCRVCGVRLLDPPPSAASISAIYADGYFRNDDPMAQGYTDYLGEEANHRATFRRRIRALPPPARSRRLLDVGAAAGFFVAEAASAGWSAVGLEPNPTMVAHARTALGLEVSEGTLESATLSPGSFEAVTLWEVIEHIPAPREMVGAIFELLEPGGFLALSTPDAGSRVARIAGRRWLGWRKVPEHLYFFDRSSLRRLLTSVGFDIVRMRYVSIVVPVAYAWERLTSMTGVAAGVRLPERIARIPLPINPLYDLLVVARKPV